MTLKRWWSVGRSGSYGWYEQPSWPSRHTTQRTENPSRRGPTQRSHTAHRARRSEPSEGLSHPGLKAVSSALYGSHILAGASAHDLAGKQCGIRVCSPLWPWLGEHPSARCLPCVEENTMAGQEATQWKTSKPVCPSLTSTGVPSACQSQAMLQVTLVMCRPGSRNNISKNSDSIKLNFGILSSLASSWFCFSVGSCVGWGAQCALCAPVAARICGACALAPR